MSMVGRTRSCGHVLLQGILKYAIRRTFLAVSIVQACNILSGKILKSPQPWVIKSKRDKSIRNDRNIDHCNLRLGQVLILGCIKINGTETLGNTKYYSHPEFHHTNRLSYHVNPESILKLAVWAKIYSKGVHFSKFFFCSYYNYFSLFDSSQFWQIPQKSRQLFRKPVSYMKNMQRYILNTPFCPSFILPSLLSTQSIQCKPGS